MKVLIISHNPITTYNSMGKTLATLFSRFDKNELCQLYIYPNYPDIDYCASYYRVTDKDILKQFTKLKLPGNEVKKDLIGSEQKMFENPLDENLYRDKKNKLPVRRLARDFIWKISHWNNKKFKTWIEQQNPTCIFVAPGAAMFLYNIALKIAKERKIPIITYICDEYYFVTPTGNILERFRIKLLKRKINSLMSKTKLLVVISDELNSLYSRKFGVDTNTIMTGSNLEIQSSKGNISDPTAISYFGGIRNHRYISLAEIGYVLDEINIENNVGYKLKIYTAEKDKEILSVFEGIKSIELFDFITGDRFKKEILDAELLLHVEAFDKKMMDVVKHSVSTKIADSLASGVPLIAYGPENLSSMKHLIRNECAFVIKSKKELKEKILNIFLCCESREKYVANALKTAQKYHVSKANSSVLYGLCNKLNNS